MTATPNPPLAGLDAGLDPLDDDTRVRQSPRVACRVYDGLAEVITLDQPIRQHRLNAVGTRIWLLSERAIRIADLGARLAAEFTVDEATARADAREFCRDLVARGILVVDSAGGPAASGGPR